MLEDNEYVEIEGRQYGSPQLIIDESNQFIDNLRATQQANTQQIAEQTANLGTEIPSSLGGLTGGESYWTSRLQTPQANAMVANLRATAQAAALNQALANEQAMWQKRYQDAYRAYQKRQYDASKYPTTQNPTTTEGKGKVTITDTDLEGRGKLTLTDEDFERGGYYIQDMSTNKYGGHDIIWVTSSGQNVRIPQLSDGSYATSNVKEFVKTHGGGNLPFIGGE